jgi:hypothetical protein
MTSLCGNKRLKTTLFDMQWVNKQWIVMVVMNLVKWMGEKRVYTCWRQV